MKKKKLRKGRLLLLIIIAILVVAGIHNAVMADKDILGTYEIPLEKASSESGAQNAVLAAELINGYIIFPGEEFSYNEVVGERTAERGFVKGPIATQGTIEVTGYGGGICMTSSILHQAVLDSGLPVLERHNHVSPVKYLPPGEDAAIMWGIQDYRFQNSLEFPIKIVTSTKHDVLRIDIVKTDARK